MSLLKKNIVANISGKAFSALFMLIFVPFYLKYLGIEAYGLIGFFLSLQMVLLLVDVGFSGAITREVALQAVAESSRLKTPDLCKTFECIYIVFGILLMITVFLLSEFIANDWINVNKLSSDEVSKSIVFMGIVIGFQFPIMMYQGVLNGLQQQVASNVLLIVSGLVRGLGAVILFIYVEASLEIYFQWQVVVCIVHLLVIRYLVWCNFKGSDAKFDFSIVKSLFQFAAGMALIGVTSTVLVQADKLILAKIISLENFGYYSLAGILASVPMLLAGPVHTAVYPRFTQIIAEDNMFELTQLYHLTCQLLAVIMLPLGFVVIAFSKELLFFWTGDASTANNTFLIASILATGTTLSGLMYIPYAIQLASGWTSLPLTVNVIAIILVIPLIILLANLYGAIGAASVWVILNTGYVLGTIQWMHRRILPKEKWNWYINDVGKPLLISALFVLVSRLLFDNELSVLPQVVWIIVTLLVAIFFAILSASSIRKVLIVRILSY